VRLFRISLAALPLALVIGGSMVMPSAYAQNADSKTGAGPRGTAVAPSTNPAQAEATPKPPVGMEKSGTPVARSADTTREAMSSEQAGGKPKKP